MVRIIGTEPALYDLDTIADYIALDDDAAAHKWGQRVIKPQDPLINHTRCRSIPPEMPRGR